MEQTQQRRVRFGEFELDPRAGELHKNGEGTVLQEQQLKVLLMLIAREGEIVTRDDIKNKLWPSDTVVEFDHGINSTIRNLRRALEDNAQDPKYIETIARRGYRLTVTVEWLGEAFSSERRAPGGVSSAVPPKAMLKVGGLTGTVVSHYRVLEVIGGGGMGLVYRAEDLKLGRLVALKFLPEEVGDDVKARERFRREAQAVSSLNHPNICTVYDFDEYQGHPFIAMEWLQGKTLRDHLADGRFRLSNADGLEIAIQIASGLEAAHEKGIIHRDIKPANIVITEKNVGKILDFGVAKVMSLAENSHVDNSSRNEASAEDAFNVRGLSRAVAASAVAPTQKEGTHGTAGAAPLQNNAADHGTPEGLLDPDATLSVAAISGKETALTHTGAALGTAGYMSPEQVRGEKLDSRTDIFSFGLVLYEMATGQRAFSGGTAELVHKAIINKTPAPVQSLNSKLPPKLGAVIDKALEKERERRYQSAAEVRTALEQVRRVATPVSIRSRRWKKLAFASLAVFLIAAGAAAIWWSHRPLALRAFQKYSITPLTYTGNVAFADISRDGKFLAYGDDEIGKQSIWLQQLATSTTVRVLGPVPYDLGHGLRFSPDGNYIYYSQRDTDASTFSLYRLAVLGGSPQRVLTGLWAANSSSSAVDISPDGNKIVFAHYTEKENYLLTANADGSGERRLLALPAKEQMRLLTWSPDGQTIGFGIDEKGVGSMSCIAVIPSQGGKERRIFRSLEAIHGISWLADQSGFAITGLLRGTSKFSLWTVSYPDGSLRRVSNDVADYHGVSLAHESARLVTIQKQIDSSLWVAPALNPSQAAQLRDSAGTEDGLMGVAWIAGERLVYGRLLGMGEYELWLVDRDGSNRRQLTNDSDGAWNPSATPAGTTIIFSMNDDSNVWTINADGSNLKQITNDSTNKWNPELSPDGKWITYAAAGGPWKKSLAGGEPIRLDPNGDGDYPTISPDGRWIAFVIWDEKAKKFKVKIVAADGTGSSRFLPFPSQPQVPESTNLGPLPIRWTPAGDAVTYVGTQNGISNIWSQPIDGSAAKQLTNFTSMYIWRHAWSPDGKWLVMARGNFSRDAVMLTDVR